MHYEDPDILSKAIFDKEYREKKNAERKNNIPYKLNGKLFYKVKVSEDEQGEISPRIRPGVYIVTEDKVESTNFDKAMLKGRTVCT